MYEGEKSTKEIYNQGGRINSWTQLCTLQGQLPSSIPVHVPSIYLPVCDFHNHTVLQTKWK